MIRRLAASGMMMLAVLAVAPAAAAGATAPGIDVVVVSGSLDGRLVDFVVGAIEDSEAQLVILQLDSRATLDGDIDALLELIADPPLPVAVWAGPDPAWVAGGAARVMAAAAVRGAAPGVVLGPASPTRAGHPGDGGEIADAHPDLPVPLIDGPVAVADDLGGFLDLVEPSIGQFVVGLDGLTVPVGGGEFVLETAETVTEDGAEVVRPSVGVRFVQPGIIDRTIRLGTSPDTAFFFLVAGLSLAVFEFYAAGPGLAAVTAAFLLLLGGYGLAVLPVRWWAIALIPIGLLFYTVDFQRNDLGWRSLLGTAALLSGGLLFTDAAPQIVQTWWIVLLIVIGTALWFGFALTTVVRARFSTDTIGREHLVGRTGVAATSIAPEGTVEIDGAGWQARSTRGSGIVAGDTVRVMAVDGVVLEVDPVGE